MERVISCYYEPHIARFTSDVRLVIAEQIDAYLSSRYFYVVGFSPCKISRCLVGRESSLSHSL